MRARVLPFSARSPVARRSSATGEAWVLADEQPGRALGPAHGVGPPAGCVDGERRRPRPSTGSLARRALAFRSEPAVWRVEGRSLVAASPEPLPAVPKVDPRVLDLAAAHRRRRRRAGHRARRAGRGGGGTRGVPGRRRSRHRRGAPRGRRRRPRPRGVPAAARRRAARRGPGRGRGQGRARTAGPVPTPIPSTASRRAAPAPPADPRAVAGRRRGAGPADPPVPGPTCGTPCRAWRSGLDPTTAGRGGVLGRHRPRRGAVAADARLAGQP